MFGLAGAVESAAGAEWVNENAAQYRSNER
jgi:hypothetical protein